MSAWTARNERRGGRANWRNVSQKLSAVPVANKSKNKNLGIRMKWNMFSGFSIPITEKNLWYSRATEKQIDSKSAISLLSAWIIARGWHSFAAFWHALWLDRRFVTEKCSQWGVDTWREWNFQIHYLVFRPALVIIHTKSRTRCQTIAVHSHRSNSISGLSAVHRCKFSGTEIEDLTLSCPTVVWPCGVLTAQPSSSPAPSFKCFSWKRSFKLKMYR